MDHTENDPAAQAVFWKRDAIVAYLKNARGDGVAYP
jgi:hypothetical protein